MRASKKGGGIIFRTKFLPAILALIPLAAQAQPGTIGGSLNSGSPISIIDSFETKQKTVEISKETAPSEYSTKSIDPESLQKISDMFTATNASKSGYVATIDLMKLVSSPENPSRLKRPDTGLMLGIRRPYYRLGRDIRVAGSIDFKFSGSLARFDNLATIIFGYDLRKNRIDRGMKMEFSILEISFKIAIPIYIP